MRAIALCALLVAIPAAARADKAAFLSPGLTCRAAIAAAEQAGGIPQQLMSAIGRVESGRPDPATGIVAPWPWTINVEGQGSFFDTKAQAIEAVRAAQAQGKSSIDVGCMQVNLMHHPDAFPSLEAAFDPMVNAAYAAKFLNELHAQTGDWARAAAMYHSATPDIGAAYERKVLAVWPEERRLAGGPPLLAELGGTPRAGALLHLATPSAGVRGAMPMGRGLAAYRAAPIALATRPPRG
jgi:hypothetical protein